MIPSGHPTRRPRSALRLGQVAEYSKTKAAKKRTGPGDGPSPFDSPRREGGEKGEEKEEDPEELILAVLFKS